MQHDDMSVDEIENLLQKVLGPKLREVLDLVRSDPDSYLIQIPSSEDVDLTVEELGALVAKSSNAYGRIARLSGMARAELKLAKGRYDRKYKTSKQEGKNAEERTANAMEAAEEEHIALSVAESIVAMLDSLENGARIASESARKIYDKVGAMKVAYARETHGYVPDKDYDRATGSKHTPKKETDDLPTPSIQDFSW